MTIGQKISRLRKQLNMSVEELATKLGKNRATVYRYEKGDIENLPLDMLAPLANALETTPAYLMGWEESPDKHTATVGELLKVMRLQRQMSIEEYSKEIGISADNLRKYESGEKYIPMEVVNTISEYYRLSMEGSTHGHMGTDTESKVRIDRLKIWNENFGDVAITDEEHEKIVEYTKFLIYIREK